MRNNPRKYMHHPLGLILPLVGLMTGLACPGYLSGQQLTHEGATSSSANPSWVATGPMGTARQGHTATVLPDGEVLVTGGVGVGYCIDTDFVKSSAEIYDPSTGTWRSTDSLSIPRRGHTATLLHTGQVLVSGGNDGNCFRQDSIGSAELYNPATGRWHTTGSPLTARSGHTATLLEDGRVLVVGGKEIRTLSPGRATALEVYGVELYDPATGTWSSTAPRTIPSVHTATLLPNGKVLAVGGMTGYCCDYYDTLRSAELYDAPFETPVLAADSSKYCVGATWTLRVTGAAANSPVRLLGISNGESWEISRWGTTGADGIFTTSGTLAEGTQGRHSLRVEIGGLISTITTFEVTACN